MNERIRKIAIEADAWCVKYYFGDKFYDIEWGKKVRRVDCAGMCQSL